MLEHYKKFFLSGFRSKTDFFAFTLFFEVVSFEKLQRKQIQNIQISFGTGAEYLE
jgi:hypothetical protein